MENNRLNNTAAIEERMEALNMKEAKRDSIRRLDDMSNEYFAVMTGFKPVNHNIEVNTAKEAMQAVLTENHNKGVKTCIDSFKVILNDKLTVDTIEAPRGPLMRVAEFSNDAVRIGGMKKDKNKYRFTRDFIIAGVEDDFDTFENVKLYGLFVIRHPKTGRIIKRYVYSLSKDTRRPQLEEAKTTSKETRLIHDTDEINEILANADHYRYINHTQSMERKTDILLCNYSREKAFAIMNAVTGGALMYELVNNDFIFSKRIGAKISKRIGMFMSSMVPFGRMGTKEHPVILIEDGAFNYHYDLVFDLDNAVKETVVIKDEEVEAMVEHKEDHDVVIVMGSGTCTNNCTGCSGGFRGCKIKEVYIKKEDVVYPLSNELYDGMGLCCATYNQDVLAQEYGVSVSLEEACRIWPQARKMRSNSKIYEQVLMPEPFNMAKKLILKGRKYSIIPADAKVEDAIAIMEGNEVKQLNRDALSDGLGFPMFVLDISRVNRKVAKLSHQAGSKFFAANVDTCDYVARKGIDEMKEYVSDIMFSNEENGAISGSVAKRSFTINESAMEDISNLESLLLDVEKFAIKKISKLSVSVDGMFLRAQFDFSWNIALRNVLRCTDKYIEVFTPNHAIDGKGVVVKFPCPTNEEYQNVKTVSLDTIKTRINKMNISDDKKAALISYFTHAGDGSIIIAGNNIVKEKLAGMDTDYDGVSLILDKTLVNAVWGRENIGVGIVK